MTSMQEIPDFFNPPSKAFPGALAAQDQGRQFCQMAAACSGRNQTETRTLGEGSGAHKPISGTVFTQIFLLFNPSQCPVPDRTSCIFIRKSDFFLVTPKVTQTKFCSGKSQQGRFHTKVTKWVLKRFLQIFFTTVPSEMFTQSILSQNIALRRCRNTTEHTEWKYLIITLQTSLLGPKPGWNWFSEGFPSCNSRKDKEKIYHWNTIPVLEINQNNPIYTRAAPVWQDTLVFMFGVF